MRLSAQLDSFQARWRASAGQDIANTISQDNARLLASGMIEHALKAGAPFPDLALSDASGQRLRIYDLLAKGPAIITFYRGGWCPYCSLELRAYQHALAEIQAAGGQLIAISPETPEHSADTAQSNALGFTLLSDAGGQLAAALGIRFEMAAPIIRLYQQFGHDLPQHNGDGKWSLPIPASYVLDRAGLIRLAFVDPDYRQRLEPAEAIKALQGLA